MKTYFILAVLAALWGGAAVAQEKPADYPTKPITLIVPSGAGGDADRLARAIATYMGKEINNPFVVDNHPGSGQLIGHKFFLSQPADGYTFMVTAALPYIATNIYLLHANFKIDDFDYIDNMWQDHVGIYVNKDRPWKTLGSLIDAIKATPGKISASVIFGSSEQIALLALEKALGLPADAVRIATYDGGADTKTAVAGGTVDFTANQVNGMQTVLSSVVPLGLFEAQRIAAFNGPTVNEVLKAYNAHVPDIAGSTRAFVSLPAFRQKYPQRYAFIVAALQRTLARPDFKEFMKGQNMEGNWIGPEASKKEIQENYAAWGQYVSLFKK